MAGNQRLNATITIGGAVSASLGKAVGTVNAKLGSIGGSFGAQQARLGTAIERNNAALANARSGLFDAVGAYYALRGAMGAPMRAAADFETVLEDIGQKSGIPTERLGELGEQIKQVARDTNQGAMDIGATIDALVGRGASMEVAMAAADPIGRAATAYRAATDDLAAASWAAVDNLKVPADQIETALDMMAQAGKEGAFELRDMATYFPALGAAYQGLGQSGTSSVADLAAALQVVRKGTGDSSTAATNLQNVLQKIYAPATVKKFGEAGVDVFAEMEKSAQRGLTPIEAIAELTEKTLKGDLSRMGDLFEDAQVQAGMRSIIQNMDEYRRIRGEAMGANGVVSADYARRIKTAEGASKRWAASLNTLAITFGAALLPAINDALDAIIPVIGQIGDWIALNPELVSGLAMATAGVIAFKGAVAAIRFVGLVGKGGALDLMAIGMGTIGRAGKNLRGAGREAVALQVALGAMGGQSLTGLQKVGIAIGGMVRAVPGLGMLAEGVAAIGAAAATISAPVWGALAVAVGAVAYAGSQIYKYWDRISSVFSGVAQRVGEELAPMFERLRPLVEWVAPIGGAIADGWARAGEAIGRAVEWIGSLFSREILSEDKKAQLQQSGYVAADALIEGFEALPAQLYTIGEAIFQRLWDGMKSVADRLTTWVGEKIDAILQPFRDASAAVGGMFGGGGGDAPAAPATVGGTTPKFAVGGSFKRGPIIVGERGPELRFEDRAGFIATARQTRGLGRAAEALGGEIAAPARERAATTRINLGGIVINAAQGMDPTAIAREVERVLRERMRGALYDGVR